VAKQTLSPERGTSVRTRRAYFDCRFGQLHVRTAFPTTGGFDEEVPLICLHEGAGSSRTFAPLLSLIATNRSVYAPDLPGCGESDPAPSSALEDAALAVADLAADLRLRQIDVLGFRSGAGAALELAAARPSLVRRRVLIAGAPLERVPDAAGNSLVLGAEVFELAPASLVAQIRAFLEAAGLNTRAAPPG
jgi:pimeloyl-ACP methyl ester carboxylesterase